MTKILVYFDHLPRAIQEPVIYMAHKVMPLFGENLLTLAVVGESLSGDFKIKTGRIRTFMVVKRGGYPVMKLLAAEQNGFNKNKLASPLVVAAEELPRMADGMGIEFLDYQYIHSIVYGVDPFGELYFDKEKILAQCRHRFNLILRDMQYNFIKNGGKAKNLEQILYTCLEPLPELFRALLWLHEVKRDREIVPVINKVSLEFGLDVRALSYLMELKVESKRPDGDQIPTIYEHVYCMMEILSQKVQELDLRQIEMVNQQFQRS